ncbi:Cytochrome b2, mitochondrial [Saitozyma sp. JCM 24511]|nr:Cytochrome b2, mitochondrial [Saitozyma sp. JCM 24511]
MAQQKGVDGKVVAEHNSREKGVWIVIHGKVYDMTDFLDEHPGGAEIILKYAGMDATEEYDPIHPPDAITDNLDPSKHLGPLIPDTLPAPPAPTPAPAPAPNTVTIAQKGGNAAGNADRPEEYVKPPLEEILSLHDFEAVARRSMNRRGWNYYSSGADDEITMRENHNAYHRVWFRPRILRNVKSVDFSTSIWGYRTSMPVYITATALGKLGHPEGEVCLTRAAAKHDIIQMIPTLASCSFDEMVDAASPGQVQFLQLYVNADRARTVKIIKHAKERGVKALFVTVDAPQLGRREKDMRTKFEGNASSQQTSGKDNFRRDQGAARAISSFIDPSLNWDDLAELADAAKGMKVVLKGVQCWEDAVMAAERGLDGVVLSNHGGRQLDFAPSPLAILPGVVAALRAGGHLAPRPDRGKFEIFVDGGVRRATDVLKAVALGATAVGIGRPMIYSMSTYGEEGVSKALQILKDEFEMNMRLLGAPTIHDVVPSMVDTSALHAPAVGGTMYQENYEQMMPVGVKARL